MLKILIVDDSNFMRKNLAQLFTQLGHSVAGEAGNGFEAFEM
jgi:YesN/AraC family two-component response regulator